MGNNLEYGDIIRVDRGIYYHYGVYADDRTIYQYASHNSTGEISGDATVHCTTIDGFARGGKVQKLEFSNMILPGKVTVIENENTEIKIKSASDYVKWIKQLCRSLAINPFEFMRILKEIRSDYKIYTPYETIARAESRLGESTYNLALNNCESYAMWCKTGVNISYQTLSALFLIGPLFPELVISKYAVAAYSLLSRDFLGLPSTLKQQFLESDIGQDIIDIKNYLLDNGEDKNV